MTCLVTVLFVVWETFLKNLLDVYYNNAFLFFTMFIYIYIYIYIYKYIGFD